ncbi:MAG: hypothetical protein H6868_04200 [Rhodospirillales bacterium]|nr:hypothetical protein [Rhodospirillales bacterium]
MEHDTTRLHVTNEFIRHREDFIIRHYFLGEILPAMMRMTEQLTAVAMHQVLGIGMFLDAKQQLEAQRLFQVKVAEAHKDYHSSMQMCSFGTTVRSVAASQRNAEYNAYALSEHLVNRQLLNRTASSNAGPSQDRSARLAQFRQRYCDKKDDHEQFVDFCLASPPATINRDIDYTRVVDRTLTLKADFSDAGLTSDEQDIVALASNLYGHEVFEPIPPDFLSYEKNQPLYLDMRAVVAKRSVALNSFDAIVGMRTEGAKTGQTSEFVRVILRHLGVSDGEAEEMLGEYPSYQAIMELLTKKIYQDPEFYTNLYDKPANVDRIGASLRAIGLMQDMDLFKSHLRNEMLLSQVLELEIDERQTKVQNNIGTLGTAGKRQ